MSAVFIVVPIITAFPILLSAAVAVASTSGFTLVEQSARALAQVVENAEQHEEIELESREEMAQILESEGGFTMQKEDLVLAFYRTRESGTIKMVATGSRKRTKEELKSEGIKIMNQIIQRYAYDRLMQELKKEGFKVATETRQEDQSISLKVRKY
jgi:hypothetical protein